MGSILGSPYFGRLPDRFSGAEVWACLVPYRVEGLGVRVSSLAIPQYWRASCGRPPMGSLSEQPAYSKEIPKP